MTETSDGRPPGPPEAEAAPARVPVPRHVETSPFPGPTRIPLAEQPPADGQHAHVRTAPTPHVAAPTRPRVRRWQVLAALLLVSTAVLAASTTYLWRTSDAWEQRAAEYEQVSYDLGSELADARAELADTHADLDAVSAQLQTAQTRIIELADEKAQIGDDREAQRQLVDYQERVSQAAGRVALALDQCVQGQNQLIGYLENAELYDPEDLDAYALEVQDLCQAATDANTALQSELSR